MCNRRVARCCKREISRIPVFFILLVAGWSVFVYFFAFIYESQPSIVEKVIYSPLFVLFLLLFLTNYIRAVFTESRPIPAEYELKQKEFEDMQNVASNGRSAVDAVAAKILQDRRLTLKTTDEDGHIRICSICKIIKPDRTHHCSTCQCCVMKMDHHCPWVNNCVGYHNYKFFVVFLFWGTIYCLFIICTTSREFVKFWSTPSSSVGASKFQVMFMFLVAAMFAICQFLLLAYHLYLMGRNMTTLESYKAPKFAGNPLAGNAYSRGFCANVKDVLGESPLLWGLPLATSRLDGLNWPTRLDKAPTGRAAEEGGALILSDTRDQS